MKNLTIRRCGRLYQVVSDRLGTVFQTHSRDDAYDYAESHNSDSFLTHSMKFLYTPMKKYGKLHH